MYIERLAHMYYDTVCMCVWLFKIHVLWCTHIGAVIQGVTYHLSVSEDGRIQGACSLHSENRNNTGCPVSYPGRPGSVPLGLTYGQVSRRLFSALKHNMFCSVCVCVCVCVCVIGGEIKTCVVCDRINVSLTD